MILVSGEDRLRPMTLIIFVDAAKDFIRRLLEFDPRRRLSLSAARHHPWLKQSAPSGTDSPPPDDMFSSLTSIPESSLTSLPDEEDAPMLDVSSSDPSMSDVLEQLQLDQDFDPFQGNGGRTTLQRQSLTTPQAADNGINLPGPSWQVLDTAGAAPARAGKRKLNEHDPQAHSATMEDGENVTPHNGVARKKGKQVHSDVEDSAAGGDARVVVAAKRGGRGRGRGRGAAQVKAKLQEVVGAMVVEEDHMEDETEPPRPRRSSRTSPTKTRKG